MIAQDLIYSALRQLGVLRPGQTGSVEAYADGLQVLNDMVDGWATENLTYFDIIQQQFPLIPGLQNYTWGTNAPFGTGFNGARPESIVSAGILTAGATGAGPLRTPLELLTREEWFAIAIKAVGSTLPTRAYYETSYPLGTLWLWPYPTAAVQIDIEARIPLANFAALTTNVVLPPGYAKALKYCLAADLIPMFRGLIKIDAPELDRIERIAAESLMWVKTQNNTPMDAPCDPAIIGPARLWNWITGAYQR